MLREQSNFLIIGLLMFAFIFICYAVLPYLKLPLPNVSGRVVKGSGQTLPYGYPTANMKISTKLKNGIYTGDSKYGKVTLYSENNFCVKCHIHNFSKNILGELLRVTDLKFIKSFNKLDKTSSYPDNRD